MAQPALPKWQSVDGRPFFRESRGTANELSAEERRRALCPGPIDTFRATFRLNVEADATFHQSTGHARAHQFALRKPATARQHRVAAIQVCEVARQVFTSTVAAVGGDGVDRL